MPEVIYTSVSWTSGDVITEAKLDNMVANDRAVDAMAQGVEFEERSDPSTPVANKLHMYAKDEDGYTELFTKDPTGQVRAATPRTGTVEWGGWNYNNLPEGLLLCDGSAISRTTYAKLFAVIGTKFGVGDGSTTFNVPNLIQRFIQGIDTAITNPGATGGATSKTSDGSSLNDRKEGTGGASEPNAAHTHTISDVRPKYLELTPAIVI